MKNSFVIAIAKILNFITKILRRNSGNLIGKIARKMSPNIIEYFKIDCPVIAVTATNGKTSTNNCINYLLRQNGKKVVSNCEGNNMETGIITTLIKNANLSGKIEADYITLEVDESYVPVVFSKMRLDTLIILDFFRDQLDRNGEVETLILKINEFLKNYQGNLILNNDDPNVARLGQANPDNPHIYYYSVDKYNGATNQEIEAGEGKFCPFDKTRLKYEYYQYSHIGKYKCPKCGYGNNFIFLKIKNANVKDGTFDAEIFGNKNIEPYNASEGKDTIFLNRKENSKRTILASGTIKKYKTLANSIYAIYNFAAVLCVARLYNLEAKETLSNFKLNNGRSENLLVTGVQTNINLAKNPTGANVSLRIINEDEEEKELLFVLNDNAADGLDVSWIWDINFEMKNVTRVITSGKRAYDIAIRIKTSGVDAKIIETYTSIEKAVQELYKTNTKKYVIANYTALQPTRHAILKYERNK